MTKVDRAAFYLKDEQFGLDSLVNAIYESHVFRIEIWPPVSDQMLQYVIPYCVARYSIPLNIDKTAFGVSIINGAQPLEDSYKKFKTKARGATKNLATILYGIGRRLVEPKTKEHSEAVENIPDVEHMDLRVFNEYVRNFLEEAEDG
jgi:hypothetical protein